MSPTKRAERVEEGRIWGVGGTSPLGHLMLTMDVRVSRNNIVFTLKSGS